MNSENDLTGAAAGTATAGQDGDERRRCTKTDSTHRLDPATAIETLATLAELFPAAFTVERWQPHRPLKIGIHQDLIDRGVLLPRECRVLRWYVGRLMYQRALAAGEPRYDLDGNVAGEVSPGEIDCAKALVAHIETRILAKPAAARVARQAARAERRHARSVPSSPPPPPLPSKTSFLPPPS